MCVCVLNHLAEILGNGRMTKSRLTLQRTKIVTEYEKEREGSFSPFINWVHFLPALHHGGLRVWYNNARDPKAI